MNNCQKMKQEMDNLENHFTNVIFKILIEANEQPSDTDVVVTHCIEYKLKKRIKKASPTKKNVLDFMVDIAKSQSNYMRLINESHARLELVKLQYKNRPYTVRMIRKTVSDEENEEIKDNEENKENESESDLETKLEVASCSGYSSDSENSGRGRKLSTDTEPVEETPFQSSDGGYAHISKANRNKIVIGPNGSSGYSSDSENSGRGRKLSADTEPAEQTPFQSYSQIPRTNKNKIVIGPNGTEIDRKSLKKISWSRASIATSRLCYIVFGEQVLTTHTISGKSRSSRIVKKKLDPLKVEDITHFISSRFNVTKPKVRYHIAIASWIATRKFYVQKRSKCL